MEAFAPGGDGADGFNGAATFQSRKFGSGDGGIPPIQASMGPQPSSRGNVRAGNLNKLLTIASMGPQPSSRGNRNHRRRVGADNRASMGPQPSSRGNSSRINWRAIWSASRFNGAATFQSRKCAVSVRLASGADRRLQWGRNLPVAEIPAASTGRRSGRPRFNGAATFQSRKCRRSGELFFRLGASMGPQPSSRGNYAGNEAHHSLGLLLQWGRNLPVAEINSPRFSILWTVVLQWGRNLPVAEITISRATPTARTPSFNGAATFQSRKC